jgi:hypothetical protein
VKRMTSLVAGQEAAVAQLREQTVHVAAEAVEADRKRVASLLELIKERGREQSVSAAASKPSTA